MPLVSLVAAAMLGALLLMSEGAEARVAERMARWGGAVLVCLVLLLTAGG